MQFLSPLGLLFSRRSDSHIAQGVNCSYHGLIMPQTQFLRSVNIMKIGLCGSILIAKTLASVENV